MPKQIEDERCREHPQKKVYEHPEYEDLHMHEAPECSVDGKQVLASCEGRLRYFV